VNPVAENIVQFLRARGETVTFAESVTGGAIASEIVKVPGASQIFKGSIIAYSELIKTQELEIPKVDIERYGVVSQEVATAMAKAARVKFSATWGIGVTGVAGPGPLDATPAGTVWLAIEGENHRKTLKFTFAGSRESVLRGAVESALEAFERILSSQEQDSGKK
jgi:nicotinamide-nucleotide amidase